MRAIRSILTLSFTVLALLAGFAVSATPAHAVPPNPPCEWEPGGEGTNSECDGLAALDVPHVTHCSVGVEIDEVPIGPSVDPFAYVALDYHSGGGLCRTVSARIVKVSTLAECYAKVERTTDQQAFYVGAEYLSWRSTQVVYDAGVRSYAWGRCTYFGSTYSAGTRRY